ncbi:MAG: hypothetical protein HQK51_17360 [Oligoflexia bacterium]|nr:hypothetical protein [Oligoflexia bacterium]
MNSPVIYKITPSAPPLPPSEQVTKEAEDVLPPPYIEDDVTDESILKPAVIAAAAAVEVTPPKEISRECTRDPVTFVLGKDGSSLAEIIFSKQWKRFMEDTYDVKLGKIKVSYDKAIKNDDGTVTYINPRIKVEGEDVTFSPSVDKNLLANLLGHSSASKMKPSKTTLFKNYKNVKIKGPQELALAENAEKEDSYVQSITCKIDDADDFERLKIASKEMVQEKQRRDDQKRAEVRKLLEQAAAAREQSAEMTAKQKQIKAEEERMEAELAKAKSEIAKRDKMQQELKAAEGRKAKLAQEQIAIKAAQDEASASIAMVPTLIAKVEEAIAKISKEQEQSEKEIAGAKDLLLAQLKKLEQAEQARMKKVIMMADDTATGEIKTTTMEAVYTQVKIGGEIAWKDPEPRGLIWLDTIKVGVDQWEAINYCKEVNKKYSNLGYQCRLPSKEEYEQLGKDMGYGSSKRYTPQVFSDLNRWFWLSSVFSSFSGGAFFFDGSYGYIGSDLISHIISHSISARCVCDR